MVRKGLLLSTFSAAQVGISCSDLDARDTMGAEMNCIKSLCGGVWLGDREGYSKAFDGRVLLIRAVLGSLGEGLVGISGGLHYFLVVYLCM